MKYQMIKNYILLAFCILTFPAIAQKNTIIDYNCIDLQKIPDAYIAKAKTDLHIYFAHASHGANLTEGGMSAIVKYSAANALKYSFNTTGASGALHIFEDLGDYYPPLTDWNKRARAYIENNPGCNVMMWGPSNSFVNGENNTGSVGYNNAKAFIDTVEQFITEFGPGSNRPVPITFVYMTPPSLSRYYNNWSQPMDKYCIGVYRADSLMRKHCIANNRWLFEFYSLSTHNPDGENFGGMKDDYTYDASKRALDDGSYSLSDANHTRTNWAINWANANPTTENALMAADSICVKCQHSDGIPNGGSTPNNARLTCVMKGKAAWWLWARLAGWKGPLPADLIVADSTVTSVEVCFNATNKITVSTATVESTATANFIAGTSISFLPGFYAKSGSLVSARITENASYCDAVTEGGSPAGLKPENKSLEVEKAKGTHTTDSRKYINLFPNPNNGQFTLEIKNSDFSSGVFIYNMLGDIVYQFAGYNGSTQKVNLSGLKKGIYVVKVIDSNEQLTTKMVVN